MLNFKNEGLADIIKSISRDKELSQDSLVGVVKEAIVAASKKKYGENNDIRADFNIKSGEISVYTVRTVVDTVSDTFLHISLEDAKNIDNNYSLGDEVTLSLPLVAKDRHSADIAKSVLYDRIQNLKKQKEYDDFKDRVGEILNCTVKRISGNNVIMDLGGVAEAIMLQDQMLTNDNFAVRDKVKAYLQRVERKDRGVQIFLSRADDEFIKKLFANEVPEIYDGIVKIMAVAREPGSKAKVAVHSTDFAVDPLRSCIGIAGKRVNAVSYELNGEKIDILLWSQDIAQFAINTLSPATTSKVVLYRANQKIEAVIPQHQLHLAIGRKGQNVRLASKLIGWDIEVLTEEEQSRKKLESFNSSVALFVEYLEIEELTAQMLVSHGFNTIEQVALGDLSFLLEVDGVNEEYVESLKSSAESCIDANNEKYLIELEYLGFEQELLDIFCSSTSLQPNELVELAKKGIKSKEDLEDISFEEIASMIPNVKLDRNEIDELIRESKS